MCSLLFLLLSIILLYEYAIIYVSLLPLMILRFFLGVELLGHRVGICLVLVDTNKASLTHPHDFPIFFVFSGHDSSRVFLSLLPLHTSTYYNLTSTFTFTLKFSLRVTSYICICQV
jgi:hypothetical protein